MPERAHATGHEHRSLVTGRGSRCRSEVACWQCIAAVGVLWRSRCISSGSGAPAMAAHVDPEPRRSWKCRPRDSRRLHASAHQGRNFVRRRG